MWPAVAHPHQSMPKPLSSSNLILGCPRNTTSVKHRLAHRGYIRDKEDRSRGGALRRRCSRRMPSRGVSALEAWRPGCGATCTLGRSLLSCARISRAPFGAQFFASQRASRTVSNCARLCPDQSSAQARASKRPPALQRYSHTTGAPGGPSAQAGSADAATSTAEAQAHAVTDGTQEGEAAGALSREDGVGAPAQSAPGGSVGTDAFASTTPGVMASSTPHDLSPANDNEPADAAAEDEASEPHAAAEPPPEIEGANDNPLPSAHHRRRLTPEQCLNPAL